MNPHHDFSGKVALVTAASAGIGLATGTAYLEAGAAVVLADVSEAALKIAVTELHRSGYKAIAMKCDVSDEADASSVVNRAASAVPKRSPQPSYGCAVPPPAL